jgi:hypothetical protein
MMAMQLTWLPAAFIYSSLISWLAACAYQQAAKAFKLCHRAKTAYVRTLPNTGQWVFMLVMTAAVVYLLMACKCC